MATSKRALIFAGFAHLIEGGHLALAREIDDKVAGDGEEPGIEAGFAVVLRAAEQDTHPGFLEEIFGGLAFAGEEEEIAQEAMLVGLDELIEEGGIVRLRPRAISAFSRWVAETRRRAAAAEIGVPLMWVETLPLR